MQNQKVTIKELAQNMDISIPTAQRYLSDIKKHYSIKIVLMAHIQSYFKTDAKGLSA